MAKKKYLRFVKLSPIPGRKMNRYKVYNDYFQERIGMIHFKGAWRQFVFRALPRTDMNRSCNNEVNVFIDKLMVKWREELKRRKK